MADEVSRDTQYVWIVQDFSTSVIFAVWRTEVRAQQYVDSFPASMRDWLRIKKHPLVD